MKNCVICGKKIRYPKEPWDADTLHPKKYCYYKCIKKSKNVLRRIRVEKTHEKTWPRCHEKFTSKRRDTEYCSNKCRQATYRERATYGEDARKIKVIVLIDGYCPACHRFKEILESFRGDPEVEDYNKLFFIEYLNVDENKELAFSYNEKLKETGMPLPSVVLLKPNGIQIAFLSGTPKMGRMMQLIVKSRNFLPFYPY